MGLSWSLVVAAAPLLLAAGPAASQAAPGDQPRTENSSETPAQGEIIIQGRKSDRYRLPVELRSTPSSPDWRRIASQDFSCHNVGPQGCGIQPNRILTVGADGKLQWGDPGSH